MYNYTRCGIPVDGAKIIDGKYTGKVKGRMMSWDIDGRRSSMRTSKYDLVRTPIAFFNIYRWGTKIKVSKPYFNLNTAIVNKPANYIRTIECIL